MYNEGFPVIPVTAPYLYPIPLVRSCVDFLMQCTTFASVNINVSKRALPKAAAMCPT